MGTWSVVKRDADLMPTSKGLPRLEATHSPGKCLLLKHNANAPSCKTAFLTMNLQSKKKAFLTTSVAEPDAAFFCAAAACR